MGVSEGLPEASCGGGTPPCESTRTYTKSRISQAFRHANTRFKERIKYSETIKDDDRQDAYQLWACISYPVDVIKGYFSKRLEQTVAH